MHHHCQVKIELEAIKTATNYFGCAETARAWLTGAREFFNRNCLDDSSWFVTSNANDIRFVIVDVIGINKDFSDEANYAGALSAMSAQISKMAA